MIITKRQRGQSYKNKIRINNFTDFPVHDLQGGQHFNFSKFPDFGVCVQHLNILIDTHISLFLLKYK